MRRYNYNKARLSHFYARTTQSIYSIFSRIRHALGCPVVSVLWFRNVRCFNGRSLYQLSRHWISWFSRFTVPDHAHRMDGYTAMVDISFVSRSSLFAFFYPAYFFSGIWRVGFYHAFSAGLIWRHIRFFNVSHRKKDPGLSRRYIRRHTFGHKQLSRMDLSNCASRVHGNRLYTFGGVYSHAHD